MILHFHPIRRFGYEVVEALRTISFCFDWTRYDKATVKLWNGIKSKPELNSSCPTSVVTTENGTTEILERTSFKSINKLYIYTILFI